MNKRQIKLSCYLEQLNIEVVKVEMILNQLKRFIENKMSIRIIACFFVYYSKKDV